MKNIVEVIRSETKGCLDKLAFIDGKRAITYAELLAGAGEAGVELEKFGIKPGTRVALLCEDSIEYVILSLAVLGLSAAIVPVPFASSGEEIDAVVKGMKVNCLLFEEGAYVPRKALRKARGLRSTCGLEKNFSLFLWPRAGNPPRAFFRMNPAFIRFSSGTTGARKGVIISHEAILQRTDAADKGLRVTRDDTVLWVLSMSFHFVVTILLFLRRGATVILAGSSFPGSLLAALKARAPSFIYASPLHYHLLARLGAVPRKALATVRIAVSTAVELPLEISREFYDKFGFPLSQAYGIIEVGLPFINTSQAASKRGSVGRILPGYRVKLINQDSTAAGEICVKGKGFFSAYFSPWKSAQDSLQDGWFNTGDIGRIDKDGFLFILGRTKQMINFNGMKIFPFEVESVLNRHPLVQESLVYGLAHSEYGSLPAADIVLRKGCAGRFDAHALRAFCYQRMAKYKVPKEFRCVERLDKTLSGKLKRCLPAGSGLRDA